MDRRKAGAKQAVPEARFSRLSPRFHRASLCRRRSRRARGLFLRPFQKQHRIDPGPNTGLVSPWRGHEQGQSVSYQPPG